MLNRSLAVFTGLLATATGSLCADAQGMAMTTGSLCAGTDAKGQPAKSMPMKGSDMPSQKEITPSANPSTKDHTAFYFAGDFIYWQAQEDGLGIGVSGNASQTAGVVHSMGTTRYINCGYAPGFKFSMGLDFMHDGWDTVAEYTWYDNTNQTGTLNSSSTGSVAIDGLTFPSQAVGSASWSLYFNNINWELGRKFFVSKSLTLRPHVGLKGAWLHQTLQESVTFTFPVGLGSFNDFQRTKFWGVGIRGGLNTEWFLTKGFSIYADIALAEISGRFSGKTRESIVDPVVADLTATPAVLGGFIGPSINQYLRNGLNHLRPVLELALGLRYETRFGHDDYYGFLIQAGWEQQVWWNQNHFLNSIDPSTANTQYGDLSFQGLDIKVGFTF